ncbi:MAG: hypothetical protein FJ297_00540 [Planctomycetes bacterium]|nr:hypothetical protein [Planctomycetota bacterium]
MLVDGEWTDNAGGQGRIRIKGNQHIVAMAFDLSAVAGKRVERATLVCGRADESIAGVTVSTIAAPWDEMRSNGLTGGMNGRGGRDGWGYANARFPAVTGGNAFTLVHSQLSPIDGDTYRWDVPPDMVHAMAVGVAYGLAIHEHDADYSRNPTIFARDQSGRQPYLLIEASDTPDAAPEPPSRLALHAVDSESARLTLQGPASGFAYEIRIDGEPLGRHNIPLVQPGVEQSIPIRDLPASITVRGPHEVRVVTLNRTGQRSAAASARGDLFEEQSVDAPRIPSAPPASNPIPDLSVVPLADKYDRAGTPIGALPDDYRSHNPIYNGERVELIGAAGEVLGFQIVARGEGDASIGVRLDGTPARIDLYQAIYVPVGDRWIPDPLVPVPSKVTLKRDEDQAFFADIHLPFDIRPGVLRGAITISDGRVVPIQITVLPLTLPRRASFLCEMNGYGLPDEVAEYEAMQQVAYDHRVHANILHYSHHTAAPGARKSNLDMRLHSGRRMDNRRYDQVSPGAREAYWGDFAEAFAPHLTGSLFERGHRGPVPAPGFYLTFHESWPLHCRAYFNGDPDAYRAFADAPVYSETYVQILRDFIRRAGSEGWREAGFQVYFNNKGSLAEKAKAPWILDEPASYWDYRALRYFGELTDRGRAGSDNVRVDFRIDISRPEFCRGQLDRRGDLWVVSSSAFQHYRRLVTDRIERDALKVWVYGSSNPIESTNRDVQAWALDAWRFGATGVVPWQTVDKTGEAMNRPDTLGLFIFTKDDEGRTVIRHSARLKAYREVEQLIEYLAQLKARRNWSSGSMRRFLAEYVVLDTRIDQRGEADAGTAKADRIDPAGLERLKRAAANLLSRPASR